jgi:hypothetical protein
MAGFAQRLRDAFLKPLQKKNKRRLEGREQRSTTPTKPEKVVVRPDRPIPK